MTYIKGTIGAVSLMLSILVHAQTTSLKFDLGTGDLQKGYIKILPGTKYTAEQGYGFEYGTTLNSKNYHRKDALRDDYITSNKPFYFSVKLPEGNYDVKVIMGDNEGTSDGVIRAECRRMMTKRIETKKGEFKTVEFTVHLRDTI